MEVAKRLAQEQNLLILPGTMFGPDQEDYLRVAFANGGSQVDAGSGGAAGAGRGAGILTL